MSPPIGPLLGRVVREPRQVLDDDLPRLGLAGLVPPLLAITAACAAVTGAAVGAFHGGWQVPFAAIKLPFVFIVPTLVIVPAARALASLYGVPLDGPRAVVGALVVSARVSVFALALAPVLVTASDLAFYRQMALLVVACLGLAGLTGLGALGAIVPVVTSWWRRRLVLVGVACLFATVGGQTGWMLRPFVLHRALPVAFLEKPRSDIFTEVERRVAGRAGDDKPPAPAAVQAIDEETRQLLEAHGYEDSRETRAVEALRTMGYLE
ncbi:MAG: hypothetical protein FJ102_18035 [Deltaproteobacteria bacterium]|nr:hypothetical protein [Deltaproteobacteria bacterium]